MLRQFCRAALAICVAAGYLGLSQSAATACSCEQVDPANLLAEADGAFVGVIDDVADENGPGESVAWSFTATDWVKGQIAPGRVVVHAPRDSDTCGFFDGQVGEIGVFVRVRDGQLTGGLCDVTEPDSMRSLAGDGIGVGEIAAVDGFPLASPAVEAVAAAPVGAPRSTATERTWLGWLSGFAAAGVVLGAAAGAVVLIRRRR